MLWWCEGRGWVREGKDDRKREREGNGKVKGEREGKIKRKGEGRVEVGRYLGCCEKLTLGGQVGFINLKGGGEGTKEGVNQ